MCVLFAPRDCNRLFLLSTARSCAAASQELFRDDSKTEFVVVTIPSMLAVAETERLVAQLREQVRTAAELVLLLCCTPLVGTPAVLRFAPSCVGNQ